jgi:putative thioredoxin
MRLGFALQSRGDCAAALRYFDAAIAAHLPSADPYLGRAACLMSTRDADGARRTLERANAVEPGNAVVEANLGLIESAVGRQASAIQWLSRAIATDPEFHEARFNLALAFARSGDRDAAAREARELLKRLPADAPQRSEVTRLLQAVSGGGR